MPVSVVIPTYRRAHMLDAALRSAIGNSPAISEVIVVDDNHEPAASAAAQRIVDQYRGVARLEKNRRTKGGNGARNTGILMAREEHVAFLDDDDVWLPGKIDLQIPHLEHYGVVFCQCYITDPVRNTRWLNPVQDAPAQLVEDLRRGHCPPSRTMQLIESMWFPTSLAVVRKQVVIAAGMFDEDLPCMQDLDLWLRCARTTSFHVVPQPLADFVCHAQPRVSTDLAQRRRGLRTFGRKWQTVFSLRAMERFTLGICCVTNCRRDIGVRYFPAIMWAMRAIRYRPGTLAPYRLLALAVCGTRVANVVRIMKRTMKRMWRGGAAGWTETARTVPGRGHDPSSG